MAGSGSAEHDGVEPEGFGSGDPSDSSGPNRRDRGWPNQRTLLLYLLGGLLIAVIPVAARR